MAEGGEDVVDQNKLRKMVMRHFVMFTMQSRARAHHREILDPFEVELCLSGMSMTNVLHILAFMLFIACRFFLVSENCLGLLVSNFHAWNCQMEV